jgi:NDP-sugar pyrophosphorylase family protein
MKPTLLVLAAGMASRYGGNKQTDSFGPNGETIIDYSIFDAIRAGFGKVVFIIREEFKENFDKLFASKLYGRIEIDYVFQPVDPEIPGIGKLNRTKPWGTAHAVMCAKNQIHEPFCVINADDFYGQEAFQKMADFLTNEANSNTFSMIGYLLGNTLSENGSVSRGVCQTDENGNLVAINERTKIYRGADQKIVFEDENGCTELPSDNPVSMNFWGFTPAVFEMAESMFIDFATKNHENPKSEFFIPLLADAFIQVPGQLLKVIPTQSPWFGVTYQEDKPVVKQSLLNLVEQGFYPAQLWT